MQTFRKSRSRLLFGLLLLALTMCYLHPKGHFLTEHISAPIAGLDTKEFSLHEPRFTSFRGWKKIQTKPGAEEGNGNSKKGVHPLAPAEHGLGELPSILLFAPGVLYDTMQDP